MIRIVTLSESTNGVGSSSRLRELTEQLRLAEIDVLCCQGVQRTLDGKKDPVGKIAESLEMTYSFSTTSSGVRVRGEGQEITITGLSILAGAHVWMLNSGSFPLPGEEPGRKHVAQYALIREHHNVFLVINAELSPVAALQLQQIRAVFSHPLLQEQYDAVLLCSNGNAAVSTRDVQSATGLSAYKLTNEITSAAPADTNSAPMRPSWDNSAQLLDGMIFTFTVRKPAPVSINIHSSSVALQPAAWLAAEVEFKREPLEKPNRFSFPLSFSEQRIDSKVSFQGLAASTP